MLQDDRDRAAEARHGGRYITGALARAIDNPAIRARFAGEDGPEALAEIWRYTASPSGSVYPSSGRDTTARAARDAAAIGGVTWAHSAYWRAPMLPEAAFDWPIYRAATTGYGDLKRREVEALHRYGERKFGDDWWPGQSRNDHAAEDAAVLDEMGYFDAD